MEAGAREAAASLVYRRLTDRQKMRLGYTGQSEDGPCHFCGELVKLSGLDFMMDDDSAGGFVGYVCNACAKRKAPNELYLSWIEARRWNETMTSVAHDDGVKEGQTDTSRRILQEIIKKLIDIR